MLRIGIASLVFALTAPFMVHGQASAQEKSSASKNLSPEENFQRGNKAYEADRLDEAVTWFRKAAEQGLADAQFNLALMYWKGYGLPQDYIKAVAWYQKAARQGFTNAQYNLGVMYEN